MTLLVFLYDVANVGSLPSPPRPLPVPSPPLPLDAGPLNPARGSGGAL